MKINVKHESCSGCTACVNICGHNAVTMQENEKGFKYPVIDENKCANCGLCELVCQCMKNGADQSKMLRTFAVKHPEDIVRSSSQSGGLFYGLAEWIIKQGGVCYGAAVDSDLIVKQIRVSSVSALKRLQGSKYVQSDVGASFSEVEKDLKAGKIVLYSGTSCMIDGLNNFVRLRKLDDSKLYTCDLVCHGVVSPLMYCENLHRVQRINKQKRVTAVNFRDPQFGWHSHVETYTFEDGSTKSERYYAELFYSHVALRDSCYQCKYANLHEKPADITMADFWGVENILPEWEDDNKGISLATVHTEKGLALLRKTNLEQCEVKAESILNKNRNGAIEKPLIYDSFWRDYFKKGFEYSLKKYTIYGGILFKVKRKVLKCFCKW